MGYAIFGPKCSMYYMLLSIWGIVMLTLMGIFFKIRSPALFEDISTSQTEWAVYNFSVEFVQEKYDVSAINCWIAAGLYVILFLFSFVQQKLNSHQVFES
ncbi:hypothetical protein BsWGS_08099 [Bradybaena similaris]